jgi:RNA-binding protein 8A
LFSEFGNVKNIHANLDRKTGYLKGYALVEFYLFNEAQKAVNQLDGEEFMGKKINVAFAFKKPPIEIDIKKKAIPLNKHN